MLFLFMQQNLKDCRIRATSIARATAEPFPLVIYKPLEFFGLPLHLDEAFAFTLGQEGRQISFAQSEIKI